MQDIVEIVLCVYMPFYNGEAHQTDCYANTIDVLQSVIEQFGAICPIHIIGDLNAQLPKRRLLHRLWYRLPGFNTHSSILYDFINDHLTPLHFCFNQRPIANVDTSRPNYTCMHTHLFTV